MRDSALLIIPILLSVGLYVWLAASLHSLFRKAGEEGWQAWVPVLNVVVLLRLGGFAWWWVLLGFVPIVSIALLVVLIMSYHRINVSFGFRTGMTVLAALLLPVWASIIGWGSARWVGREVEVAPGPMRRSSPTASGGGAPVGYAPLVSPLPSPTVPAELNRFSIYPDFAPPPPRPPQSTPELNEASPLVIPTSTGSIPQPAAWGPAGAAPFLPPPPAPSFSAGFDDGDDDDDDDDRPPRRRSTATIEEADDFSDSQTAAPRPAIWSAAPDDGPERAAPIQHVPAAPEEPPARDPWAPQRSTSAPVGATHTPAYSPTPSGVEGFSDTSAEVSAVVGAPSLGAPMAARSSVSALRGEPEIPDTEGAFDETIVAVRRRTPWMLIPPLGSPIPVTADELIIGRRPSSDPDYPAAQLVAISDETRTMSKTHARLELRGDFWAIVDLDSTNGVVLLREDGSETEVKPGVLTRLPERFLLGDAELRLAFDPAGS